jgi:hypothetical protein
MRSLLYTLIDWYKTYKIRAAKAIAKIHIFELLLDLVLVRLVDDCFESPLRCWRCEVGMICSYISKSTNRIQNNLDIFIEVNSKNSKWLSMNALLNDQRCHWFYSWPWVSELICSLILSFLVAEIGSRLERTNQHIAIWYIRKNKK